MAVHNHCPVNGSACFLCNLNVGAHAAGHDHKLGRNHGSVAQTDAGHMLLSFDGRNLHSGVNGNPLAVTDAL